MAEFNGSQQGPPAVGAPLANSGWIVVQHRSHLIDIPEGSGYGEIVKVSPTTHTGILAVEQMRMTAPLTAVAGPVTVQFWLPSLGVFLMIAFHVVPPSRDTDRSRSCRSADRACRACRLPRPGISRGRRTRGPGRAADERPPAAPHSQRSRRGEDKRLRWIRRSASTVWNVGRAQADAGDAT